MRILKAKGDRNGAAEGSSLVSLPPDAPLLTFAEAGAYLRLSTASVRKLVDGRSDTKNDELGAVLRSWVVRLSPHRRYIRRQEFLAWLRGVVGGEESRVG